MKKVTRLALWLALAIGVVLVVALLAVNLYVQSRGTQARIEQELSDRLGTTLKIQRISVTPWWGLKLTGITMPNAEETGVGDFLQADAFRLRVQMASLFSGRLVIKEVSLIHPQVVWKQNENGKWRLPTNAPLRAEAVMPGAPAGAAPPVVPITPDGAEPTRPASTAFKPEVRRVKLHNGSFRFLDEKGNPVALFEGVGFRSNFRSATALSGNASIAKTSLRDRFFLEQLRTPLSYDPRELDLSQLEAKAAGGTVSGRFTMRPGDADSPFQVMVKFQDLSADRIVSEAQGPAGMVQGKLEGRLEAAGNVGDPNALTGVGEIRLREGRVRGYGLLVALGQLLKIDELTELKLEESHVKYHITPGVVTIDELLLNSPNIRLSATGTVGFDGVLSLESQLAINERVRRQLFSMVRENFKPIELPGFTAVSFQITGTVDRPQSNLMDKVVGTGLRDLGGVIDRLFGRNRRDRAKKKKASELIQPTPAGQPPRPADPAPAILPPTSETLAPIPSPSDSP